MFRRTAQGLCNQHLFLAVDVVVFVEGADQEGKTFTKKQAYSGQSNQHSVDVKFWAGIFSIYQPNIKFKIRPVGSKSTLMSIGQDIANGKVKNLYVAMDRDSLIPNTMIKAKGIFYTHGYSWENDVWQSDTLQSVLATYCSTKMSPKAVNSLKKQIVNDYKSFGKNISIAVYADTFLCSTGNVLIPRKKHRCCLNVQSGQLPAVNVKKIDELLKASNVSKKKAQAFGHAYKIQPLRDCLGHLLSDFCYHSILHYLKKVAKLPSIAKDYVLTVAIEKFLDRLKLRESPTLWKHYQGCFSQ